LAIFRPQRHSGSGFLQNEDGVRVAAEITSLNLADIAFDSSTLRVIAEAAGTLSPRCRRRHAVAATSAGLGGMDQALFPLPFTDVKSVLSASTRFSKNAVSALMRAMCNKSSCTESQMSRMEKNSGITGRNSLSFAAT
jgi:hypothetical protein